jgi:hypothetical protein
VTAPEQVDLSRRVAGTAAAFCEAFELAVRVVGGDPSACHLSRVTARVADVDDLRVGPESVVIDLDWSANPLRVVVGASLTAREVATIAKVGDWSELPPRPLRPSDLWHVVMLGSIRDDRSRHRVRLRHFGPWSDDHSRTYGFVPWPDEEAREWLRRFSNPNYIACGVRGTPRRSAA